MIASLVVTLEEVSGRAGDVVEEISRMPSVELGEFERHARRIPITIDSSTPRALEEATRRLQEFHGVAFVDVVFVHFENECECTSADPHGTD